MPIDLPSLNHYRSSYLEKGVTYPLPVVVASNNGLLATIPPPPTGKKGWPWTEQTDPVNYNGKAAWPKLTIVTPSYNQGQFLEQTIRAVLLQNYPNLEYIIIDGGSTDNSKQIIEKYAPWLSYWQSEKDRGQGHAINLGFSLASGAYNAWINSDDYYTNGAFVKVIQQFIKTNARFVYGYTLNYIVEEHAFTKPHKVAPFVDYLIRFPSLAQPSCFWDAAIHQPIWESLHCSLDYELWLRIVKGNKRSLIKSPLSVTNVHPDAKTSDLKMKDYWHKDHLLICGEDAHGPVLNWDRLAIINRIRNKFYAWLNR
jgi:glycosyltransferase involved in cell wall biosynthesis